MLNTIPTKLYFLVYLMGASVMKYVVGIDIGGTFTDLVCIDEEGNMIIDKVPSTPKDPSIGALNGLQKLASRLGKKFEEFLGDIIRICHGTTVTTNAVLTWSGAKVGLLCTEGFRDILEIRFGIRENIYDYRVPQPKPLVPRYLRIPIEERYKWDGTELKPLNKEQVKKACEIFKKHGVEAVAICFLWSFKYPDHEKEAAEIVRKEMPGTYVTASIEVQPEIREYWRMSTTVINAYVGPLLSTYIRRFEEQLRKAGFKGELLITQSSGGVMFPEIACEQAVRTLLSGPATGPPAGVFIAKSLGIEDIITIDMGGTSFDVCLVKKGQPLMGYEAAIGGVYHVRYPRVDVHTIGAGGGSIAWIDEFNVLHVGPQSAGADPGPACYGKGSMKPTVTDADLVLGYLNPDYFLGGEIKLKPDLAYKAIKENIADPLGIDVSEAAKSIVAIADHNMTDAIAMVSVRRGEDPRKYTLVTAGGAGPVHAARLAKELRIRKILIPRFSSIFCALGSIISDIRHDFVTSVVSRVSELDIDEMRELAAKLKKEADQVLDREGIKPENRYYNYSWDMRYEGQYHEIDVPIDESELTKEGLQRIIERFHERHEALYGYRDVTDMEVINFRLAAFGRVVKPSRKKQAFVSEDASKHIKAERDVYFFEIGDYTRTPIYDGDALEVGNKITGPAVIEQRTTTIVVPPKALLEVTEYGDYVMTLPEQL